MVYGLKYSLGVSGEISDLHWKMSVLWSCDFVNLFTHREIHVCSSDVSASAVLVYSVCGYCPSETWEHVLALIHQVIYCTDIGKCLITCFQVFCTF